VLNLFQLSRRLILLSGLFITAAWSAAVQTAPPEKKVYAYVEKMPQLPGGGGSQAIVTAVQQHVVYPPEALRNNVQGRLFVQFVVEADGRVQRVSVVKGLRADCDSAVVWAVRQLPRFEPGIMHGKPVAVSFTAPVNFSIAAPSPLKLGLTSWH
jgi:protein TonB